MPRELAPSLSFIPYIPSPPLLTHTLTTLLPTHALLSPQVTDFAGGNYSGKDTLPMQIFDQRVVAELAAYYTTSERVERSDDTGWKGLWESEHPFAKILRDGDTDTKGRFLVDPAFNVVVCTQKKIEEYNLDLRNSMPMGRLQAIFPMPGPI